MVEHEVHARVVEEAREIGLDELLEHPPASAGVQGPGEISTRSGARAATWSTLRVSLRATSTSAPSSPAIATRK